MSTGAAKARLDRTTPDNIHVTLRVAGRALRPGPGQTGASGNAVRSDMQIGGHARSQGLIVVANNAREFGRMKGTRVENWV